MGKQAEPPCKVELSIGSYYKLSIEGPEDFVEDRMTQLIDLVIAVGIPVKVTDGKMSVDGVQKR